jgi:predicted sulfurtransferase
MIVADELLITKGTLYVFDGRVVMSFGGNSDTVIGRCKLCGAETENFVNIEDGDRKREHFLMCKDCVHKHADKITFVSNT